MLYYLSSFMLHVTSYNITVLLHWTIRIGWVRIRCRDSMIVKNAGQLVLACHDVTCHIIYYYNYIILFHDYAIINHLPYATGHLISSSSVHRFDYGYNYIIDASTLFMLHSCVYNPGVDSIPMNQQCTCTV